MTPQRLKTQTETADVLLVEDNPGDVRLTQRGLDEVDISADLHVVEDGSQALAFIRQEGEHAQAPRPDLVLLDLNMPRVGGLEVLEEIKTDAELRKIPVVVLTTSDAERDRSESYRLQANSFVTKPVEYEAYVETIETLAVHWLEHATLPEGTDPRRFGR